MSWCVDDNAMTHKEINMLKQVFGKICTSFSEMDLVTGNVHVFLGMSTTIRKDKKIETDKRYQIQDTIDLFKENDGDLETRFTSPDGHIFLI